jgi:molybdenum cofactor guanylyltransferase
MVKVGVGILVGGQGSRLGGVAKGLLRLRDGATIVERLTAQVRAVAIDAPLYLLGDRSEYRDLPLSSLGDDPAGVGPLGGLHALLKQPCDEVLLLGGDLPYLSASVIARMLTFDLRDAVAAKTGSPPRWEPMLSRYRVSTTLPVVEEHLRKGTLGLFALLNRLNAAALVLSPDEEHELSDWDVPEDITP